MYGAKPNSRGFRNDFTMKVTKSQTGKALTIFKFATNTLMKPMDFIRGLTVNEKRKNLGRLLSATAILCFGACKQDPEAGADTKSLDNFARGGETAFEFNWCSGDYKVKARDLQLEGSDEEKSATAGMTPKRKGPKASKLETVVARKQGRNLSFAVVTTSEMPFDFP